jgi:transposase-like protein/IS1 family transposase
LAAKGQVNCHCCSGECKKSGTYRNRNRVVQRFFCVRCGKSFREEQPLDGIRIDSAKAVQVVEMLAETMGVRAAARLTRLHQTTILNILEAAGEHCARLLDAKVRNITAMVVQADEVYSYVQCQPHVADENDEERGGIWTFLSVAKYEKLIINYRVGKRTGEEAVEFLKDLRSRMAMRFQFTTDGFRGYCSHRTSAGNVEDVLGDVCDYATETKRFKKDPNFTGARTFFAPYLVGVNRKVRFGNPLLSEATTCHAERTNLSLRTFNRRFVRRTINFSKKLANHRHAVALFVAVFNFCRVHKSLGGRTPAMAAGLTDHVWTVAELLS